MPRHRLEDGNILKSVFLSYAIIGFHILFLCGLVFIIFFFNLISNYFIWIVLFSGAMLAGSGFFLLRHLHKQRVSIAKILSIPELKGKNIEIKLLGGLASMKISEADKAPDAGSISHVRPDNLIDISGYHDQSKNRVITSNHVKR